MIFGAICLIINPYPAAKEMIKLIHITGDTHADLNELIHRANSNYITKGDTLIVTGDFGFTWGDEVRELYLEKLAAVPYTIAFIDGNHENFDKIYSYPVVDFCGGKAHQVRKNIFHLMRGEVFIIEGFSFFCFGGAYSIDKALRTQHVSWWPQEIPSREDYDHASKTLERINFKTDYVLTHTIPQSFIYKLGITPDAHDAELTGYLEWLYRELDFKKWYAGHFHLNKDFGRLHILYEGVIGIWDKTKAQQ